MIRSRGRPPKGTLKPAIAPEMIASDGFSSGGGAMPQMPDFEAWAIFAKVAEKGSFSQAAEELGLAKTTVSKAVTRLEERLRTTLLHRTTRQLSLTESGRVSLERAARIFTDGIAVEAEILEEAAIPRGLVRMASTIAFGIDQVAGALPAFMKRYPEIEVDLCLTDDRIDLVAESFDLALRIGPVADSSMRISRLFSFRVPVVGSPEFFDRHGRPAHPNDLSKMPALIFTHILGADVWRLATPNTAFAMCRSRGRSGSTMVSRRSRHWSPASA